VRARYFKGGKLLCPRARRCVRSPPHAGTRTRIERAGGEGRAQYQRTNWQNYHRSDYVQTKIGTEGPERDFYNEVNAQFGLLKVTYRNHSEHVRDERYDMPKTLHILNHVREFMQELATADYPK